VGAGDITRETVVEYLSLAAESLFSIIRTYNQGDLANTALCGKAPDVDISLLAKRNRDAWIKNLK
jgi:hypothetical protein